MAPRALAAVFIFIFANPAFSALLRGSASFSSVVLDRELRRRIITEARSFGTHRAHIAFKANHSEELFEACSAKKKHTWNSELVSKGESQGASDVTIARDVEQKRASTCDDDAVELYKLSSSSAEPQTSCCPRGSISCAGCAKFEGTTCKECAGGFVMRQDVGCVACSDTAGWVNDAGLSCSELSTKDCSDTLFQGLSSNQACCKCRGGHIAPTSFAYEERVFAIGEPVQMFPVPRTAEQYAVDEACALASYNLSMDGATGAISYMEGRDRPVEPFEVSCKITSHQKSGASFTAPLAVKVNWLSFGHSVTLFSSKGSDTRKYKLQKAPGTWKNLQINCAPKAEWLSLSSDTLSKAANAEHDGMVSSVQDMYAHQSGSVCELAGLFQASQKSAAQRKAIQFVALDPKPVSRLVYPTDAVAMVVGEKPPPLEPKAGKLDELMPSKYEVACDHEGFMFDRVIGVGFFYGDPFLEVAETGQLILSTAHSFARQFDKMAHKGSQMLQLLLTCKVFGLFAKPTHFPPVVADLRVEIRDNTCWVPGKVEGTTKVLNLRGRVETVVKGIEACRHACRLMPSCSHVAYADGKCLSIKKGGPGNLTTIDAFAKVPDCSNVASCRVVKSDEWYKSGVYCPLGHDTARNSIVYLKKGTTQHETIYLHQGGTCKDGEWALQAISGNDFVRPERGYFELQGEELECLSGEIDFAQLPCGPPENITEEDTLIQPLVLDDPSTAEPADFWLHPCDCFPAAWGRNPPVDPETFQTLPPGSTKDFIPPVFELVSGEFVCPARNLLPNGIHFETDDEVMEISNCEAKCKEQESCDFFWHGTQHSANTCRLFTACPNLVREPGLSGKLVAIPRDEACVVSNPTACWAASMRRASLMSTAKQSYWFWHLHTQCDMMLLLGGKGVQSCARPTYRPPSSHKWQHKRLLPSSFDHGSILQISCWEERFSGLRGAEAQKQDLLTCVGGKWFNSIDQLGIGKFKCYSCVQVAAAGYGAAEQRSEQELYYMNKMKLSLYSVVNLAKERKVHCMEPKQPPALDADPVVASAKASWMEVAVPPKVKRTAYWAHDNLHWRHRFHFGPNPNIHHWRRLFPFWAFRSNQPGMKRYYVSYAGVGHGYRHWIGQGPPCCGWRAAFSFYAYPKPMPGTTRFYVSMATGPHRVKLSKRPQCCGWRDVFSFYAYSSDRAGGKKGLVAWYKSEDASPEWKSSVGQASARVVKGTANAYESSGNGAASNVRYVQGERYAAYDFGRILYDEFTVCSITRYASVWAPGRILQSSNQNWLHGHWNSYVGVVHSPNGWQTSHTRNPRSTDWVTVCSSPGAAFVYVDGNQVGIRRGRVDRRSNLVINTGIIGREASDWAVMEVMAWDRTLSKSEMEAASKYLMQKLAHKKNDGCTLEVLNPPELQRSYSSVWANEAPGQASHSKSMLDQFEGSWCVGKNQQHRRDWNSWIQMDLKEPKLVSGVVIQTRKDHFNNFVYSFKVQYKYSMEGSWRTVPARFTGNTGKSKTEKQKAFFTAPVQARYIRFTQFRWVHHLCLRAGVIICHRKVKDEMGLMQAETCASQYRIEALEDAPPSSRHVVFESNANNECLALSHAGSYDTVTHQRCQTDSAQQLIPSAEIPALFTRLHSSPTAEVRLAQGLKAEFYFGFNELARKRCDFPNVDLKQPSHTKIDAQIDHRPSERWSGLRENDHFVAAWTGFIILKTKGTYTFWLSADDSARAFFAGVQVLLVGGCGPLQARRTHSIKKYFKVGPIPLLVQHTEAGGHAGIRLEYSGPDTSGRREVVPASAYAHVDDSVVDDDQRRGCIGNTAMGAVAGSAFAPSGSIGIKCNFAAVIADDEQQKLPTTRQKSGSWHKWWEDLEQLEIKCGPGRVLKNMETAFVGNAQQVRYTCGVVAGLGACIPWWTDQKDVRTFQNNAYSRKVLSRLRMNCGDSSLIAGMHFEYSMGGRWARFKYSCCKSGGSPTVVEAIGLETKLFGPLEGLFCPTGRGASGRLNYAQQPFAPWQDVKTPAILRFDNLRGKWCMGQQCEEEGTPDAEPLGVHLLAVDVAPVSDFDGTFEPMGTGASGMKIDGSVEELKKPRRKPAPKRPKPPKKPKLETFEGELPQYSDKCVGYGDLWKKISETVTDEAGEQVQEVKAFETVKEEDGGYKDAHPCDVAGSAGGTSGRMGGGDGKATSDQMPFDELDGCHTRDINRALVGAKDDIFAARFEQGFGMAKEIADMICSIIPNVNIAPFGGGVQINPGEICTQAKDLGIKVVERTTPFIGIMQAEKSFKMANEDWADCNPLQTNFARLFCDIHCVRDAVIRGDRSIIRNLKRATDVTNKNMDQLSTWIVKSGQVDAGWLGDMVKWLGDSDWSALEVIMKKMGVGDDKQLLLSVRHRLAQIRDEVEALARTSASAGRASAATVRGALLDFAREGSLEEPGRNESTALRALFALSSTLRSAAAGHSREEALANQLEAGGFQLRQALRSQSLALGEYRRYSNLSRSLVSGMAASEDRERHAMLLALDRLWWDLRDGFDASLEAAAAEVAAYESAVSAMSRYENCAISFQNMLVKYKETMATTDHNHRLLKTTWRRSTNLLGELVSTIIDGEAFSAFLREDGCSSQLARQTLAQLRLAVGGMKMLVHRFRVAGLREPDASTLLHLMVRIQQAYRDAVKQNKCASLFDQGADILPAFGFE